MCWLYVPTVLSAFRKVVHFPISSLQIIVSSRRLAARFGDSRSFAIIASRSSEREIIIIIIARPVTLPDKAKFTVCSIIKLATIAFDETSSYWSAPKSS